MKPETILKKAIEKAVKNGMDKDGRIIYVLGRIRDKALITTQYYYDIIFSHDFAKAFWGKGDYKFSGARAVVPYTSGKYKDHPCDKERQLLITYNVTYDKGIKAWIYHLHRMVESKDPIKYLEKFS